MASQHYRTFRQWGQAFVCLYQSLSTDDLEARQNLPGTCRKLPPEGSSLEKAAALSGALSG